MLNLLLKINNTKPQLNSQSGNSLLRKFIETKSGDSISNAKEIQNIDLAVLTLMLAGIQMSSVQNIPVKN